MNAFTEKSKGTTLWESVGNKCLEHAAALLDMETAPTAATVETVEKLVGIAVAIDTLSLRWEEQKLGF